jgi:hypothetical protein
MMFLLWHFGQTRPFSSEGPFGTGIENSCSH